MPGLADRLISKLSQPSRPAAFKLRPGDAFPLQELTTPSGQPPALPATGERVVIWFYPKDNTPGCTLEGRHFTRQLDAFSAHNIRVYGCSADDGDRHAHFQQSCGIATDLLTDPNGRVGRALGNFAGGKHLRSTVVLDDACKILRLYPQVAPLGHVEQLLADLA